MLRKTFLLVAVLILNPSFALTETIDVKIKGVDDGVKTTKQQDYKEAVLFAKREAVERAGVKIKALTTAKDFVVHSDYIESKAEAVLMPGYEVVDIGYTEDGSYQVVLIGRISIRELKEELPTTIELVSFEDLHHEVASWASVSWWTQNIANFDNFRVIKGIPIFENIFMLRFA